MNKQEVIDYCLTLPGAYEDYPFDEIWTVMRHGSNRKSFAFIYERDGKLCVNLKCDPFKADILRQIFKDVTPGYHMNKFHWNTVAIDGDVPDQELYDMVQHSYDLTKPKLWSNNPKIADKNKLWPNNLYYDVFGKDCGEIPDNAEEAIEYVLNMLRKREKAIVLARFREYKTYDAIGLEHGIGGSRVQQVNQKAIRMIRHPNRSRFLINLVDEIAKDKADKEIKQDEYRTLIETMRSRQNQEELRTITIEMMNLVFGVITA